MIPIHGTPGDKKTRDAETSRVIYLFIYLFIYLLFYHKSGCAAFVGSGYSKPCRNLFF